MTTPYPLYVCVWLLAVVAVVSSIFVFRQIPSKDKQPSGWNPTFALIFVEALGIVLGSSLVCMYVFMYWKRNQYIDELGTSFFVSAVFLMMATVGRYFAMKAVEQMNPSEMPFPIPHYSMLVYVLNWCLTGLAVLVIAAGAYLRWSTGENNENSI